MLNFFNASHAAIQDFKMSNEVTPISINIDVDKFFADQTDNSHNQQVYKEIEHFNQILGSYHQNINAQDIQPSPPSPETVQTSKKRTRTQFSSEQLLTLEREFQRLPYLSRTNRIHLSRMLNISEKKLKIWFQNRRMKQKKLKIKYASTPEGDSNTNSPIISYNSDIPVDVKPICYYPHPQYPPPTIHELPNPELRPFDMNSFYSAFPVLKNSPELPQEPIYANTDLTPNAEIFESKRVFQLMPPNIEVVEHPSSTSDDQQSFDEHSWMLDQLDLALQDASFLTKL